MSVNKVILAGRLVASPDVRTTTEGKSVAHFTLAVQRKYAKDKNGKRKVDFHKIVAWGHLSDFAAKYFEKGDPCFVVGELQNQSWSDENGKKMYGTSIEAQEIDFVPGKNISAERGDGYGDAAAVPSHGIIEGSLFVDVGDDEELPF